MDGCIKLQSKKPDQFFDCLLKNMRLNSNRIRDFNKMLEKFFRIKDLVVKELLIIAADPKSRFLILMPPVLQITIFSFVATLEVYNSRIGIVNNDIGTHSTEIIRRINGSGRYFKKIYTLSSQKEARHMMDTAQIVSAIEFESDFSHKINAGEAGQIFVIVDGRRMNAAMMLMSYLQEIASSTIADVNKVSLKTIPVTTSISTRYWFNPNLNFKWFIMPALLGLLLSSSLIMVASLSIAKEKEMGTFEQLIVSPLNPSEIIFGKTLSCLCIGFVQSLVLMIAIYITGIPFLSYYSFLFLAITLYCITIISIGLLISSLCTTQQQSILGVFAVSIPLTLLSGFSTPFKNMPLLFRAISYCINPVYHFLCIVRGLFLKNTKLISMLDNIAMLVVIMCISLYISIVYFKKKMP